MNELIFLSVFVVLVVLALILLPFFVGEGGRLQDASVSDSESDLEARLESLLRRWLREESAFLSGEITNTEWNQRQRYLTSRYVDAAKRLAWMRASGSRSGEAS